MISIYKTPPALIASVLFSTMTLNNTVVAEQSSCTAALQAVFIEGAPRDNFEFKNVSNGLWQVISIEIDLARSAGELIFDTEDGGKGIEVFQPYKTEAGDARLAKITQPEDGGTSMQLEFDNFAAQQSFRFSVDVDDTLKKSDLGQIRVTGGELSGAQITVTFTNPDQSIANPIVIEGMYDASNTATLKNDTC